MGYGQMIGYHQLFHEGNHNDTGNPHAQYSFPIYRLGTTATSGQYTKILSTDPIDNTYYASLFIKGEIFSKSDNGTGLGQLILNILENTDGSFKATITFDNTTYADLIRVYRRVVGSTHILDVYLKSIPNESLFFMPFICDFSRNKGWTAFRNPYSQRLGVTFYENQSYVASVADTLLGTSVAKTPIPKVAITNTIVRLTTDTITAYTAASIEYNEIGATNPTIANYPLGTPGILITYRGLSDIYNYQEYHIRQGVAVYKRYWDTTGSAWTAWQKISAV